MKTKAYCQLPVDTTPAISCWLKGNHQAQQDAAAKIQRTDAKDTCMWAAVRQLTGRQQQPVAPDGIDAECLNKHYAISSTDKAYVKPIYKHTVAQDCSIGLMNTGCSRFWTTLSQLLPVRTVYLRGSCALALLHSARYWQT